MSLVKKTALIVITGILLLGCAAEEQPAEKPEPQAETTEVQETAKEKESEQEAGAVNPWRECTQEEAAEACPRLFRAPEGAQGVCR